MNRREIERAIYSCEKLGRATDLTLEYLWHGTDKRVRIGFKCDSVHDCGVAIETSRGGSWTFDWDSCPCPLRKP
jgi:hypothetical protein